MSHYYDRQGNPITQDEWERLYTNESQLVAKDTLESGTTVSTAWLGLDHSWDDDGPPLIFETMVFEGPFDGDQKRYSTEAEAATGHAAMIASVREREAEHHRAEKLRDAAPRLAAALKRCAVELAECIEAEYPPERRKYPSQQAKYEGDMEAVREAHAALREAGVEP